MMRGTFLLLILLTGRAVVASDCLSPGDALFASGFEAPSTHAYYVATNGDNGHDGSLAAPWASIQYAATHVNAGETVCVRSGVYNELVTLTHSGSAAVGPIVLGNAPGESPIIDGTGLAIPNGQNGLISIVDASYVTVQGFELRNYTTASTAKVPIGLYVTGAGTKIRLFGNHIHDIRNTGNGCAANAFGLKVDGTSAPASINQLTISGNEIDHLVLGCSESFSLDGNVEHWTISGNTVHDTNNIAIGAIGFEGVAPDPAYDQARDGVISDNLVYNISSFGNPAYGDEYAADGIYVDGGTRITIERNRIHHVDLGIELASEHSGRTTSYVNARSNLVYFGNSSGISLGGYANGVGGTDHCTVIGNSLLRNDQKGTGSGELQIQYHASNNLVANNIVHAGAQGVLLYAYTGDSPTPATLDHNLYFSDAGVGGSSWTWHGTEYDTYAGYRAASSQDAQSSFANPLFVDLFTPDLQVGASSPAIGAGTNPGDAIVGALDFAGHPRVAGAVIDIGAYER
ncbi:MAG: right-handed parallel beta-helix repeat-containing protein [Dokdonella sp.]